MLDMVGSAIIFGVLILTVARVQGNLNSTMYQNTFNINTQTTAVNVARQMEFDFAKAGYRVTGNKIFVADTDRVAFKGALSYGGTADSISYTIGDWDTNSVNARDRSLVRYSRISGTLKQRIGLTNLSFMYFDTLNNIMTTPVSGSTNLNSIRGINVKLRLESLEPTDASDTTSYFAVNWEKLIYPRNLAKPR